MLAVHRKRMPTAAGESGGLGMTMSLASGLGAVTAGLRTAYRLCRVVSATASTSPLGSLPSVFGKRCSSLLGHVVVTISNPIRIDERRPASAPIQTRSGQLLIRGLFIEAEKKLSERGLKKPSPSHHPPRWQSNVRWCRLACV
jgi:hypothetical protein